MSRGMMTYGQKGESSLVWLCLEQCGCKPAEIVEEGELTRSGETGRSVSISSVNSERCSSA